jgi:N-acetylglucosaminyldiphosphoundecaprenol N-acetyl-beta-D-mannosaminyltransferase
VPSSRKVLGIWVDCLTMEDALLHCVRNIRGARRPCIVASLNASTVVMAREDEKLRQALHASDLVLADGMPIHWITKALGARAADRVTGVDLMAELLQLAGREQFRLFFLGARPEVLEEIVRIVKEMHGDAVIAGAHDGYFTPEESPEIIAEVRASKADILFVGMPSPFKEVWCHNNREALGTPIVLPVGGAFDVLSGFIRRAPRWMQACGQEWLWRMLMDPGTKWRRYAETNPLFLIMVMKGAGRHLLRRLRSWLRRPDHSRLEQRFSSPPE